MNFKQLPSQEELHRLFDYHEEGYLICKKSKKIRGCIRSSGYSQNLISKKMYLTHRLIWKWHTGEEPEVIDHIQHEHKSKHNQNNPYNNRIENLRNGTHSDNNQNRLDVKGYRYDTRIKRWVVQKMINYKHHRKCFKTEQEAIDFLTTLTI